MIKTFLVASAVALLLPAAAMAQGTIPGAESGARDGAAVGGPNEVRWRALPAHGS